MAAEPSSARRSRPASARSPAPRRARSPSRAVGAGSGRRGAVPRRLREIPHVSSVLPPSSRRNHGDNGASMAGRRKFVTTQAAAGGGGGACPRARRPARARRRVRCAAVSVAVACSNGCATAAAPRARARRGPAKRHRDRLAHRVRARGGLLRGGRVRLGGVRGTLPRGSPRAAAARRPWARAAAAAACPWRGGARPRPRRRLSRHHRAVAGAPGFVASVVAARAVRSTDRVRPRRMIILGSMLARSLRSSSMQDGVN